MYVAAVLALTVVLPLASVLLERVSVPESALLPLVGKWFVFWAVGCRLFGAGVSQLRRPEFTARDIFGIADPAAGKLVREIGFGNLAMGAVGIASLYYLGWTRPAALAGCIYLGLAGVTHLSSRGRNRTETLAMATDLWVAAVLAVYLLGRAA